MKQTVVGVQKHRASLGFEASTRDLRSVNDMLLSIMLFLKSRRLHLSKCAATRIQLFVMDVELLECPMAES